MELKKAQFSVIDVGFMFLLLTGFYFFFQYDSFNILSQDLEYLESNYLNSLSKQDFFRSLVFNEDLSSSTLSQDWSEAYIYINNNESNIFLRVHNLSTIKVISECEADFSLSFSHHLLTNASSNTFRVVELGVCR